MNRTPLLDRHVQLGGRVVDFHGWQLPVQYEGILAEHDHCRRAACVFDTCHMGQFRIAGAGAAGGLSRVCTQDAAALTIGQCRYGFLLNGDGGIRDDTVLMRLGEDEFLLVVNAGPREADLAWVRQKLGDTVTIEDRSESRGKLDLQGPASFTVLSEVFGVDLPSLDYFHATVVPADDSEIRNPESGIDPARGSRRAGAPLLPGGTVVSRTGYTGELGYEIFLAAECVGTVWDALLAHPAVKPAGLGARDMLRLEMAYPLYGQDITEQANPIEAGMAAFVDLSRDFIGRDSLAAVTGAVAASSAATSPSWLQTTQPRHPARKLVAFRADCRRRADGGQTILANGETVGEVTSAGYSPSLGVSIGLGYVATAAAAVGTKLTIVHPRGPLATEVVAKPPYTQGSCRTRELSWNAK